MPIDPPPPRPPNNEPVKIQVVFQGGGAKLCALMAVAEVLQEFSTPGRNNDPPAAISVKRIAGTSAGAIAAVMLASSHKKVSEFRKDIKIIGQKYHEKLGPANAWSYLKVICGYSVYGRNVLLKCFTEIFQGGAAKVSDLKPQTEIYSTDLYTLRAKAAGPGEAVETALASSCRIPIAFAGYFSDSHEVDGGLALNLPVDHLLADQSTLGAVIAVTFKSEKTPSSATSIVGYVKHLFGAAVQTNVNRSLSQVDEKNVFPIETEIGTFDFAEALEDGLDAEYDNIKYQFRDWLVLWLSNARPRFPGPARFVRPILNPTPFPAAVVRELEDRFRAEAFTRGEVISAYDVALIDDNGKFLGRYKSKIYNKVRISRRTSILTFDFQAGNGAAKFSDLNFGFMVIDTAGNPLKFIGHVQERTLEGDPLRSFRLYLLFDEALIPEAQNQPYTVELQYEVDDPFPGLAKTGDCLTLTRPSGGADEMTVGVAFPKKALPPNCRIVDIFTLSDDERRTVNHIADPTELLVPSGEVALFDMLNHMNLEQPPENYVIVGRRVINAQQGTCFGLAVRV